MSFTVFNRMDLLQRKSHLSSGSEVVVYRGREVDPLPKREQRLLCSLLSFQEKFFLNTEHFWGIKKEDISLPHAEIVRSMDSHLQQSRLMLGRLAHVSGPHPHGRRIERYEKTMCKQLKQLANEAVGIRQAAWKAAYVSSELGYQRKKAIILFYQESAELHYLQHPAHREKRQRIDEAILRIHTRRPLNAKEKEVIGDYWKYMETWEGREDQAATQGRIKRLAVDSMRQLASQIRKEILDVTAGDSIAKQSVSIVQSLKSKSGETIQMLIKEYHTTLNPKVTLDPNERIVALYVLLMTKVYLFITITSILREARQQLQASTPAYIHFLQEQHENQISFEENYLVRNKEELEKKEKELKSVENKNEKNVKELKIEIKVIKELILDSEKLIRQLRAKTADYWKERGMREINQALSVLDKVIRKEEEDEEAVSGLEKIEQTTIFVVPDLTIRLDEVDKYFVRKKSELDDRKLTLLNSVIENMS